MSTPVPPSVTWLAQEAHDRLTNELNGFIANRVPLAKEIDERRQEGDLKENGGYHAAREEQGKQEGRIAYLEALLRTAKVGEAPPDDGIVEAGMVVTILFEGDSEPTRFLLGSREGADTTTVDVYSPQSPLGQAIDHKHEGETVQFAAPNGKTLTLKIVSAKPFKS